MKKIIPLYIVTTLLLTACGQFSYKRGAGVADLTQAQQACQAEKNNNVAVEQCLERNGWVVKNLDDFDPVATIMPTSDNRGTVEVAVTETIDSSKTQSNASNRATNDNAPARKPANILDEFKISSWWKLGGSTSQLNSALDECVGKLGEAHKPDPALQKATRGLLLCMRDSGWHGLQAR